MAKKLGKQSYRYICFEIARLRTRFDNEKDDIVRNMIAKRYLRVIEEFNRRSDNWFWTEHVLDTLVGRVKKDTVQGHKGKWITLEGGQKLFIRDGETVSEATSRLKPSKKDTKKKLIEEKVKGVLKSKQRSMKKELNKYSSNILDKTRMELKSGKFAYPAAKEHYAYYKEHGLTDNSHVLADGYAVGNRMGVNMKCKKQRRMHVFHHEMGHILRDAATGSQRDIIYNSYIDNKSFIKEKNVYFTFGAGSEFFAEVNAAHKGHSFYWTKEEVETDFKEIVDVIKEIESEE